MKKLLKNNGLTIVLMLMFMASLAGHLLTGWQFENAELGRHGEPSIGLLEFARDPLFLSTLFENWESEFLQMAVYVVLTAYLFQRGSAESRDPDEPKRDQDLAAQGRKRGAPAILKAGAVARWLYAHSLGLALFLMFAATFFLHWFFSAKEAASDALSHGEAPLSMIDYLPTVQLWFESFQNWQSEFLSTAVLVVLSIHLREAESPESKAVAAPHSQTGT